ncbi:family 10 glycosylhydrolase, partial [Nostoc sp. CENA67]
MSHQKKKPNGCGCSNIPLSLIILIFGGGYWWFSQKGNLDISKFLVNIQQITIPILNSSPIAYSTPNPITSSTPTPFLSSAKNLQSNQKQAVIPTITRPKTPLLQTPWEKKVIRGIYLSRYQITNNTDEQTIRERVRYYRSQGINTIIHGVWGNGCTMYNSEVLQQTLGYKSCPNQFQDRWLDWLIDEAHKQGMQVHAYFEKGIKIDKNSPIYDLAISRQWVVPGVDKTYVGIDHYVLDVQIPNVGNLFKNILVEFVQKYPKIDAVQWDDYLGYYAELPGKIDRTAKLTKFLQQMITAMKQANSSVSFDICHHNPYWAKRYFAADWQKWHVDRVFIQAYNEANFKEELNYAKNYAGIAITDQQLHRLKELVDNQEIKSILVFPLSGKPEETASRLKILTQYEERGSRGAGE